MNTKFTLWILLFSVFLFSPARAGVVSNNAPGSPGYQYDPRSRLRDAWLVRIKPGEKADFYDDGIIAGCPALKDVCRKKAHLIAGDIAVANHRMGAFTVINFVGKTGNPTDGAIETRLLENVPETEPVTEDWTGKWKDTEEQQITIRKTRTASILAVDGDATWYGRGGTHEGSFAAYIKPTGAWGGFLTEASHWDSTPDRRSPDLSDQTGLNTDWTKMFPLSDTECSGIFRLMTPYLTVATPVDTCGGVNVTFTGVYRKVGR
ncbi:hypothetical protein LWC05_13795 [Acetobacter sicerae]|uniref:Uncharacterized protein n=1 Tax=Acetobacter sicerae TaxID=85325 RepID=A0ABS8W0B6_9PROT|nr:hypothetical protein [Acetobacter sicerae]MCE0744950.1 hypothetical protein [Acetobacter sicerae]